MPMSKLELGRATTGSGRLPHHNIDSALEFSFQLNIPFLPQIPIRNPWEYMIASALEGMPGLHVEKDTSASLNLSVWTGRSHSFNERLLGAFAAAARPDAFESFEPSAAASSCWQPFLWELEERKMGTAKIQVAGPMTAQWALRLDDGSPCDRYPEIAAQIYRLVLARALAMSRRLQAGGIQPIVYFDEPGLYGLSAANARHVLGLQELKLVIQALRKEKVVVGLHCCSNTDWEKILGLGLDIISLDTALSLYALLDSGAALETFLDGGGRLSLGVIPTSGTPESLRRLDVNELHLNLVSMLETRWKSDPARVHKVLNESLYTPACGLALHSPTDAEFVLSALLELRELVAREQTH
jgi:hypothetical protein